MIMTPSGFGAVLFGWFTAEIGRQPYVVYGHLRTADAVSGHIAFRSLLIQGIQAEQFLVGWAPGHILRFLRRDLRPRSR